MDILQEKLDYLVEKYHVGKKVVISGDTVTVDGKKYALLPWRNERRFIELKKIVENTVGTISHFKIMSLNPCDVSLETILKRELDTAEFISGQKVTEIFLADAGKAWTVLLKTDKDAVFTFELSDNLEKGAEVIDKHEIITDRGTTCDRAVDSQTPLSSIYVYSKDHAEYTDVDFELYGLSVAQTALVRQAFDVARNAVSGDALTGASARLDGIVKKAKLSAEKCENIIL